MGVCVLIHGAWHGGLCWGKVIPLLEEKEHAVLAPDLPGHGNDETPISEVSLQAYTNSVCRILDAQSDAVTLLGHSMGGVVITQAAEYRPQKIKKLVCLTAFLLKDGEFLSQYCEPDMDAPDLPNLLMDQDQVSATSDAAAVKEVFYGDCSEEDVARAKSLLGPQATAPFSTPVNTTPDKFGEVPRVYITCNCDRAISPSFQEAMHTNVPCERIIEMNASHLPFFSAPKELVDHLLDL